MNDVQPTDDSPKFGKGNITAQIKAVYYSNQFLQGTKEVPKGEQIGMIVDRTNFYAEQGGQEYDTGKIIIDGVAELEVQNVQVYAGYVLHTGYMKYGSFAVGDEVICEFDELRRWPIRNNHTGTHILNFALREVLGEGIDQKGSLVAPEKLRFDFSHKAGVSIEELEKIEDISTKYIRQNCEVYAKDVPLATAKEILGVRAVFGETYPDPVRVVSVGVPVEDLLSNVKAEEWREVSIEFCGGTHVLKTGDIKELVIIEESGIAKGIRRIVAVTGTDAHEVQRVAKEFGERLERLEKMPHGHEKEQEVKTTQADLNQLSVSWITKSILRDHFAKIVKAQVDEQKAQQKADAKKALDAISNYFSQHEDKKQFVAKVPVTANQKAISEAVNHVQKKDKDKTVYLFAVIDGKVIHGCHVSQVSAHNSILRFCSAKIMFYRKRTSKDCRPANGPMRSQLLLAVQREGRDQRVSVTVRTRKKWTKPLKRPRSIWRNSIYDNIWVSCVIAIGACLLFCKSYPIEVHAEFDTMDENVAPELEGLASFDAICLDEAAQM